MAHQETSSTTSFAGFRFLRLREPLARRLLQLLPGLVLFGVSIAMALQADLGTNPWTVFHQGVTDRVGPPVTFGMVVIGTGLLLVLLFRIVDEPLGLGTALNVVVIGVAVDLSLLVIPEATNMVGRLALLGGAPLVLGLASGLYIGAGLGPGPRDGLMTALSRRGLKTWQARTLVETSALAIGWLLGGKVFWGTLWMAVAIGPCVQLFLKPLTIDSLE